MGRKKGQKLTKEHRKKISNSLKGKMPKNIKKLIKSGKQFEKGYKPWNKERKLSDKEKKKISINTIKGMSKKSVRKKISLSHIGKSLPESTKKKMRISGFNYVKKICDIKYPRIGHNEKKILDDLEKELDYKIIRQFECEGYFIDGYIKEINVAIEVDERPKINKKDIERENIIKNKLNCKFVRIIDYE